MTDLFFVSFVFLFGIALGSFLNVIIYRLPRGESLMRPPSHCPKCDSRIKHYDNIPILSYLILGAKCRNCKASISVRYPLVELLTGLLFAYSIFHFGLTLKGYEAVFLSFVFMAVFFIDLDHQIIPNEFTIPGVLIGLILSIIPNGFIGWLQSLIGALVGAGIFWFVGYFGKFIFKKEAMGLGDVKFAAMLGAFFGWQKLILILVAASFLGSIVGIMILYFSSKKKDANYVPFGPFLVVAALIAMYLGDPIINAYLHYFLRR